MLKREGRFFLGLVKQPENQLRTPNKTPPHDRIADFPGRRLIRVGMRVDALAITYKIVGRFLTSLKAVVFHFLSEFTKIFRIKIGDTNPPQPDSPRCRVLRLLLQSNGFHRQCLLEGPCTRRQCRRYRPVGRDHRQRGSADGPPLAGSLPPRSVEASPGASLTDDRGVPVPGSECDREPFSLYSNASA